MYEKFYGWGYSIGEEIMKAQNGEDLLKKLIYNIRAEETPGRFLDRLSETIGEYRTNRNIAINISMHPELYEREWFADSFYYLKSSILTGLLNALARRGQTR
jgi:hypothetical protein